MNISTDTLFHITNKESLIAILRSKGFKPSFCKESIILKDGELPPIMFAMVCFCDIPFHLIQKHINLYSEREHKTYGIGLTKEWGIRNGLNPVFYLQDQSTISDMLFQRFAGLIESKDNDELVWDFMRLFSFIKPYEAANSRFANPKYRFYDEREWRWIPPNEQLKGRFPFVSEIKYDASVSEYKNLLKSISLTFEAEDISYLILDDKSEQDEFIEFLEKTFSNLDDRELKRLIATITTGQYIIKDS